MKAKKYHKKESNWFCMNWICWLQNKKNQIDNQDFYRMVKVTLLYRTVLDTLFKFIFFPLTKWKEMGSRNKTWCNRMGSAVLKVLRTISGYWSGHTPVTRPTSLYLQTKGKCSSNGDSGGRRSWETWLGGEHVRHPWAWCMMRETNVSTLPVERSSEHRTAERGTIWS